MPVGKLKTVYFCQQCGHESPKWLGKCPGCGQWNSLVEETRVQSAKVHLPATGGSNRSIALADVEAGGVSRTDTRIGELNRVLGGGLVPGSVVLFGGEPGIGKSTLALQLIGALNPLPVLYISGEESPGQIKLRADRLKVQSDNCRLLADTSLTNILDVIRTEKPGLVIIDSIQTIWFEAIESPAGSVSQVRECTARLLQLAKTLNIPLILIGHITKEGNLAGPKVLEHLVDVVLLFEGDSQFTYRVLRSMKNRFGSTSEIGIFEMSASGLREIANPSGILIFTHQEALPGVAIGVSVDGFRPFLIEIQALASSAVYGTPQRSVTGFDLRRLNMLLAVLEKKAGFKLSSKDVFLNLAGGLRVDDTGLDMAVAASVLSSNFDVALDGKTCFAGEIGLTGEIRPVQRLEQRVAEAAKMGFTRIFLPSHNKNVPELAKIKIEKVFVSRVEEMVRLLFR